MIVSTRTKKEEKNKRNVGDALDNGYNRWGCTRKTDTNYIKGKKKEGISS